MAYNNFYKLTYDINKQLFPYPQAQGCKHMYDKKRESYPKSEKI
jgi:hypothetical protein